MKYTQKKKSSIKYKSSILTHKTKRPIQIVAMKTTTDFKKRERKGRSFGSIKT
jgi:hypothetical protein